MSKHERFILTPISSVIHDAVLASSWCSGGVEEQPLCDYFMQSLFLKLTGFGEQKLKCILWDIATDDFAFRYEFIHNSYGECSSLSDKNKVLRNLVDIVLPYTDIQNDIIKDTISDSTTSLMNEIQNSVFISWFPREYVTFQEQISYSLDSQLLVRADNNYSLFRKKNSNAIFALSDAYDHVYRHRNRCAHNLMSYQENLPALSMLSDENYAKYENWFTRYWVLVIIDKVFVRLYSRYLSHKNLFV